MTQKEMFEQHKKECRNCILKDNCDGIHLTINNTTVCEKFELKKEKLNV